MGDRSVVATALLILGLLTPAWAQPTFAQPGRYSPSKAELDELEAGADRLSAAVAALPKGLAHDLAADVAVYEKAVRWVIRFREFFEKKDVATTRAVIEAGLARARLAGAAGDDAIPWAGATGTVARGFVSKVDASVQPYAVVVPEGLELSKDRPARLDVVLHGRNQTLSEVRFLASHDGKSAPKSAAGKITLHVYGRGNNAYRWAGETDVFEAIEAVKRNYPVDDRKVVLRGFSMGGAGAWHLGLHHPSTWSSVEAGAGFSETKIYAKLKNVPPYQEKALHIYDSVDYALNAFNVPTIGYGGEDDPQRQASANVFDALKGLGFAFKTEGLVTTGDGIDATRVVGAGMGHKIDPASQTILDAFHDRHIGDGAGLDPKRVRFVTYTLKYPRVGWLQIEGLVEHYRRTEVDAEVRGQAVVVGRVDNVAAFSVDRHAGQTVVLGGEEFPLESAAKGLLPRVYFRREGAAWKSLDYNESRRLEQNDDQLKRPGVQGPIDDAFTGAFFCVVPTGVPWNPAVGRWSDERFARFRDDWAQYLRGDVRVKKDVDVTDDDLSSANVIAFGDPGSNRLLARMLPKLPMNWTRDSFTLEGKTYASADHAPVLITRNPINPSRYLVVNSGPTFGAREFQGTNALLYPRLGDFAVFQTGGREGVVESSGYFDEGWSLLQK